MADAVLYEVGADGVCLITLNRPDAGNSWCGAMRAGPFYPPSQPPVL